MTVVMNTIKFSMIFVLISPVLLFMLSIVTTMMFPVNNV